MGQTNLEILQELEEIRDKIADVVGNAKLPPQIEISESEALVSKINFNNSTITFSQKAYYICKSFGNQKEDALAFILGHELAHYYNSHNKLGTTCQVYGFSNTSDKKSEFENEIFKTIESSADIEGVIYAYLAGYNSENIRADVIRKIYEDFKLNDNSPNYPNLQDRLLHINNAEKELSKLIPSFETAYQLFVWGEYDDAINIYEQLINKFPSREMYSNAAACMIAAVLNDQNNELYDELKNYVYPLEIDLRSNLITTRNTPNYGLNRFSQKSINYIRKAKMFLKKAKSLDPTYIQTYINEAVLMEITNDDAFKTALNTIKELADIKNSADLEINYNLLLFINYHRNGDIKKAEEIFTKAKKINEQNTFIKKNQHLLNKGFEKNKNDVGEPVSCEKIKLNGQANQIKDIVKNYSTTKGLTEVSVNEGQYIYLSEANEKTGISENQLKIVANENKLKTFISISENYKNTSGKGIKIGDSIKTLIEKYGEANISMPHRTGFLYCYDKDGVTFFVNAKQKVESWTIYESYSR